MSNSHNTLFYIETLLILDPFNGCHQGSVKFLNSPIFFAQKGESFRSSLAAIDPNDFKLRYAITPNKQGQGIIVDDYFLPENIKIDTISGLLVWDNPHELGEFNFAVIIKQFKENILQGFVVRDFQVIVGIHNQDPIISVTGNNGITISLNERILILPTELLEIKIEAEDMQSDSINIKAISELLIQSEDATFQLTGTPNNKLGSFSFLSNFDLDRDNPYIISFRATSYLDGSSLNKDYSYAIYTRNVEDRVIVSLEDFRKMDLPTLVPNPIQDYFMVRTVGASYGMLKIFDLHGKLLNQIQWIGNTLIPRSKLGLSNGTYIYRLNSRVSFLKQGKIVIQ